MFPHRTDFFEVFNQCDFNRLTKAIRKRDRRGLHPPELIMLDFYDSLPSEIIDVPGNGDRFFYRKQDFQELLTLSIEARRKGHEIYDNPGMEM